MNILLTVRCDGVINIIQSVKQQFIRKISLTAENIDQMPNLAKLLLKNGHSINRSIDALLISLL